MFIHGRAQQGRDPAKLKQEWVDDLAKGLAQNGLPPIDADRVRFPFYGDALDQMAHGKSPDEVAEVILKGDGPDDDAAKRFLLSVFDQVRAKYQISDDEVEEAADAHFTEKGPLNWPWVRAVLQKLDTRPELSAATIALATFDVFEYLTKDPIRRKIDDGVKKAMTDGAESVVVGHSLGSVVAYTVLRRFGGPQFEGGPAKWKVPLFVTVGSPLAVNAIQKLAPAVIGAGANRTPECASAWFNAMDPRDVVSLFPLDAEHFRINPENPAIENKTDVDNPTQNRHGISGYLGDPVVAKRIHEAMQG
ncbi:hypothetical protein A5727_09715 [Mycobacterium sp. ACS4331]|nr:hypothetical protein A5727_09715 [Mycobacterium sp. ACS4331]